MTAITESLVRSEDAHHLVGEPDRDVEELSIPKILKNRDAGFDQVTAAIHLVHRAEVAPFEGRVSKLKEGVEVTIRLLGGCDQVDGAVHHASELLRVRPDRKRIRGCLD